MAGEEITLGTTPEALAKRQRIVTLQDGKTVVVHKWSNQKYRELLPLVGMVTHVPTIAEQSVAEADRERVRALDFEDLLEISVSATALNLTPSVLKNLPTLIDQKRGIERAVDGDQSPSKAS